MILTGVMLAYTVIKEKIDFKKKNAKHKMENNSLNIPLFRNTFAGFPPKYRTTLRYFQSVYTDVSVGLMGTYSFRANGIYDPDLTGIGHQPLGRDTLAEIYTKSIVIGSRCTAKPIISDASSVVGPVTIGLMLHDGDTPMSALSDTLIEQGRCTYSVVSANSLSAQSVSKPLVVT